VFRAARSGRSDALTGLFTRRYLDRRLGFEVQQAHEDQVALSVGLLDVDHFGRVNKEHGWPTGDRVLADTAARVREALRDSDWAARYGGEEICIVLRHAGLDAARAALERVAQVIRASPSDDKGEALTITVSIGCAQLATNETTGSSSVQCAAARAKGGGRDRVC
jgi:diguanylate cyclase (GGDEF)-like protein